MKRKQLLVVIIGAGLLLMYLTSIFSSAFQGSSRSNFQLPENNVIDYRLNPQLKALFINYSSTIMTFEYNFNCENCYEQKQFLETMATGFKQELAQDFYSIYLEEIFNETLSQSVLTIESYLGSKQIINPTENETFNELCDLMAVPPVICAAR